MSKITRRTALQGIGAASLLPLMPLNLAAPKEKPTACAQFYMAEVDKELWIAAYNGCYRPSFTIVQDGRNEKLVNIALDKGLLKFSVTPEFFCSPIEVRDGNGQLKYRVSIHDPADRDERLSFCNNETSAVPYINMSPTTDPRRLLVLHNGAAVPKSLKVTPIG